MIKKDYSKINSRINTNLNGPPASTTHHHNQLQAVNDQNETDRQTEERVPMIRGHKQLRPIRKSVQPPARRINEDIGIQLQDEDGEEENTRNFVGNGREDLEEESNTNTKLSKKSISINSKSRANNSREEQFRLPSIKNRK